MKINIEHIEERMFDYYEGNLSEQEKNDLLNLIHQHPEYEVEFTRWAQSYAHVDHSEPDYGLTKQLLKKPVLSAYLNRYTIIASALLILSGILTYSYMGEPEEVHGQSVQTVQAPKVFVEEKQNTTSISKVKSKASNPVQENHVASAAAADVRSNKNMQSSGSAADTISKQTAVVSDEMIGAADETQQVDTVAAMGATVQTNTKTQEKKKVKYKTKVTLKPSPDIIPTNPNF